MIELNIRRVINYRKYDRTKEKQKFIVAKGNWNSCG